MQYLTLKLSDVEYAIDILSVQEIRSYETPVRMVNSASYAKGIINLRGTIVPILDLRLKFNLPNADLYESTIVIVLNINNRTIGVVVDSVSDVINIEPEDIKPAPEFDNENVNNLIKGLVNINGRLMVIANIEPFIDSASTELYTAGSSEETTS
jgi:purine-binding chemotaxis protein CheW